MIHAQTGSFFPFLFSSCNLLNFILAIVKMEKVISEHLKDKSINLLTKTVFYKRRPNNLIQSNSQGFEFYEIQFTAKVIISVYESINITERHISNSLFEFVSNRIKVIVEDRNDSVIYHLDDGDKMEYIGFTKSGRVTKLNNAILGDTYCYYDEENVQFNLFGKKAMIKFHSDGSIKKYGQPMNSKKHGLYYDSDEFGIFKIFSYIEDKLHGYYFDNLTLEQGFYENGVKVGFWKEQGRIINYDISRIFFVFPIFFL